MQSQDSPVFNYINNLSPIKTVKSLRISQTFNSFGFASLPSVFTSPHVNSVKESKFLRRHPSLDLSKPELSSKNGKKVGTSEGVTDPTHNSDEEQENFDPASFIGEASAEQTYECTKLAVEVSQNLNYDCGSPDCSTIHCHGSGNKCVPDFAGTSTSVVQFVQEVSETCYVGSREHAEGTRKTEQNADGPGCDWESMISDTTDLLIFNSPNEPDAFQGSFQKSLDTKASACTSLASEMAHDQTNNLPKVQVVGSIGIEQHETGNPSSLVGENNTKENEATGHILAGTSVNKHVTGEPSEQIDNEPVSNLHRGMRRRCLVFEMVGARRKHVDDGSSSASSIASQSNVNSECNDKQLVPIKPGNDSSRYILPGIGLHLNALARTSKECSTVCNEPLGSGRQLIDDPTSSASFRSLSTGQEPPNNSLAVTSSERNRGPAESGVQVAEDASQAPGYIASEEFSQSSPKKKRRRAENGAESEGCNDTAGQERYHSLAPMYYRGAAAAIIVYDITNQASFERAKKWVQELQAQGNRNMVMALAGNKVDLLNARKVPAEDAQVYAQENGLFFMETSAKAATNVNDIFYEIAKRLPRVQPAPNPSGMVLTERQAEKTTAASCCS